MPGCSECRMLVENECLAHKNAEQILGRPVPPPPLGACEIPIVEDYLNLITAGMHVLEVGCGTWNRIKSHCDHMRSHYEGIDTQEQDFGKKTVATRIENLANLSFPDESFDIVIGTQSMEHWAEFSCTLQWGLYQCFRACKPGGYVLMNVPIHFHGTRPFMLGELQTLQRLFAPFSDQVTFHKWGYPSDPLTKLFPYPGYSRLHDKPAYILDIHAIKDRPLPNGYTNLGAASGRLAKLLNSHPSYITYRAFDKAKQFFASIGLSSFHQDETPEFKL